MADSTNLTNDKFGFSCYVFSFPASPEIVEKVSAIERASGMTRAKIPAHITVKGTFHAIEDLDRVKDAARHALRGKARFWIGFENAEIKNTAGGAGLHVKVTVEMQSVHDALVAAMKPLATTVYRDEPFRAHLTFYEEAPESGIEQAMSIVRTIDLGPGFEATAVDLAGRRGPAYGGRWELVERFDLK